MSISTGGRGLKAVRRDRLLSAKSGHWGLQPESLKQRVPPITMPLDSKSDCCAVRAQIIECNPTGCWCSSEAFHAAGQWRKTGAALSRKAMPGRCGVWQIYRIAAIDTPDSPLYL